MFEKNALACLWRVAAVLSTHISLCMALYTFGCSNTRWVHEKREVFHGIEAEIEFEAPWSDAQGLLERAFEEFATVSKIANAFDKTSEVGRINATFKSGPVKVSDELYDLLEKSAWAFAATEGAFDPTIWPLKLLWREASLRGSEPSHSAIVAEMEKVGFSRVHLDSERKQVLFERGDMALDFGGIAKGWVVDRVARLLEQAGVKNYLVRCGGEIVFAGRSRKGKPWYVGIRNPLVPEEPLCAISGVSRTSVSTSGPTEQPVVIGGRFYHHIIDPKNGHPAPISLLSVTVTVSDSAPAAARADALSTALSVLGHENGARLLEKLPGAEALFVVANHGVIELYSTPGFICLALGESE